MTPAQFPINQRGAQMCIDIIDLGKSCGNTRRRLNITQKDVAGELNYSVSSISAFERGENNNAVILAWYVLHGFDVTRWYNEQNKDRL